MPKPWLAIASSGSRGPMNGRSCSAPKRFSCWYFLFTSPDSAVSAVVQSRISSLVIHSRPALQSRLITGILVLPPMAIASVTATFARVTVTLLAGMAGFIAFIAISLLFSNGVSIPSSGHLSIPLAFCFCATVVVLQYAARRVWVSRLLLVSLPIVIILSGLAIPESIAISALPRSGAGQEAPVQLTLTPGCSSPGNPDLIRANQVR